MCDEKIVLLTSTASSIQDRKTKLWRWTHEIEDEDDVEDSQEFCQEEDTKPRKYEHISESVK